MARSWTITGTVETLAIRCIARVRNSSISILIGLHDVKLRAELAAYALGVTVLEWVCSVSLFGYQDRVECCQAVAANLAQVHIILECATEHIGHKVLRCIELLALRQVHPVVVIKRKLSTRCCSFGPFRDLKVQSLLYTINHYF